MPIDVAFVTCLTLPEPDPDQALLSAAVEAAGLSTAVLAWDDPAADFGAARVSVLRSTWNYSTHYPAFLAWVERTAPRTALWNRPATLRWNTHKRYLLELAAAGLPVVPTALLERGSAATLAGVLAARGWSEVVVKPAVSGGSRQTVRVRPGQTDAGEHHLRSLLAVEDALVQPFFASVEGYGERAIIVVDGEPTHAVRKSPRFTGDAESVSEAMPIADDERALARRALALSPEPLLYARVDMARDPGGTPHVMELEVVEPSLFLRQSPVALERLVEAIQRRVR